MVAFPFPGQTGLVQQPINFPINPPGTNLFALSGTGQTTPFNLNLGLGIPAGINAPSPAIGGDTQSPMSVVLQQLLSSLTTVSQGNYTMSYLQKTGVFSAQPATDPDVVNVHKPNDNDYWASLGYTDDDDGGLDLADPLSTAAKNSNQQPGQ
jgi:hypothetical protein